MAGLGPWGEGQLRNAVEAFFGNPYLRDYTHASKTFRTNTYENAPKFKFLFHVYFDINPEVYSREGSNFSILVKSVKLPSFNFNVATMNQYNRKRLVQSKINYDPIDITFHDDNGNLASSMWYRYYTYYYKDATNPSVVFGDKRGANTAPNPGPGGSLIRPNESIYNDRNQYSPSITGQTDWGYIGDATQPGAPNGKKIPFFKNVTIFGLNRHNWISYTLINPVITRYGHDTYDYEQGTGVMSNSMSLDYETVVYNQGAIDGSKPSNILTDFGDQTYYDKQLSPISIPGSNATILGQNGLLDGAGGVVKALSNGEYLKAARLGGVTYNTFKNVDIVNVIQGEITKGLTNILNSTANPTRNSQWDIPRYGDSGSSAGTANTPYPAVSQPTPIGPNQNAGTVNPSPYTGNNSGQVI